MMKKLLTSAALGLCAAMVFGGCSSNEEKKPEPVETDLVLGMESDGGTGVVLNNQSGMTFTEVKIRTQSQTDFGGNLLKDDAKFENEKTGMLYIPALNSDSDKEEKDEDKKEATCDLYFMTEDGTSWTFEDFRYEQVREQAVLQMKDDKLVIFDGGSADDRAVVLTGTEKKKEEPEESSDESDTEQKEEETSEGTAQEPEEPVYEEPAYQEPVYEEPVYQEPVYEEPVYEAPAEQPSAPEQGDEGCLGPGFFD